MSNSANDRYQKEIEVFLNEIWSKREEGLPALDIDWNKPVRHQDLLYLLNKYPFLQIVNTEPDLSTSSKVNLVTTPNGWVIHDYGDAMSSSPGRSLFGPGSPEVEEEGGEGGEGGGTIVKQLFDTAQAMVLLAIEKKWAGVQIVDGTALMKWAAWMAAEDNQFPVQGYQPSEQDRQKRNRVKAFLTEYGAELHSIFTPRR